MTDLAKAVGWAHDFTTARLGVADDAVELFEHAADMAPHRWPGDLGSAIAGVLLIAAERRRMTGLRGVLGEQTSMLALALTTLGRLPRQTCSDCRPR